MAKDLPLLDRIYKDPLYADLCRWIGYGTKTYRELRAKLDLLGEAYGKTRAESAQAHLLTYDGQFTAAPKPLAEVKLRSDVRRYCWQLLGPPPEQADAFWRNPDGTPMPQHAAKTAALGIQEQPKGKRKPSPRKAKAKA